MYVAQDWESLRPASVGRKFKVNELGPTVDAELIEFNTRPLDYSGEPIQGEDECSLIFRVGDRYFRKTGYQSSYYEEFKWNGDVTEVFPEEKVVMTFRSKR
jgi:hypothetical protein